MFGSRGAGNFLTKLTTGAAIVFMITSLSLSYFCGRHGRTIGLFDPTVEPRARGSRARGDARRHFGIRLRGAPEPACPKTGERTFAEAPARRRHPPSFRPSEDPGAGDFGTVRPRYSRRAFRKRRGSGGIGRRTSLRGWRGQPRGGSNPLCPEGSVLRRTVIKSIKGGGLNNGSKESFDAALAAIPGDRNVVFSFEKNDKPEPEWILKMIQIRMTEEELEARFNEISVEE